jgi:allophanate hydrolase
VEVEVWELDHAGFGEFVTLVPSPLCIGRVALEDGTVVAGFLCEEIATRGCKDITAAGGWRAYVRSSPPA